MIPFNVCVVAATAREGSIVRSVLQLVTLAACVAFASRKDVRLQPIGFALVALHYMLGVSSTGGLSSPVLMAGLPMVAAAGVMLEDRKDKLLFAALSCSAFLVLGTFSHAIVLRPSLYFASSGATGMYQVAACSAAFLATMGLLHIGYRMSRVYAEVAVELAERQQQICEESEELGRSLEGLAARMAHEVKNPLASIKALSVLEAKNAENPKSAERLQVIAREADRLKEVVDAFASFSKGTGELRIVPTRPYEIAREIAVLVEARASEGGVAIEVVGDEKLEIVADPKRLRQALLNLVLNAIQASPKGSRVRLAVDRDGEEARLRVIDRGEGMSQTVLERVQRPYFSTREGGSGLGLAVARGILEQHGGDLELQSCTGHGTTATLRLPMQADCACPLPRPQAKPERAW